MWQRCSRFSSKCVPARVSVCCSAFSRTHSVVLKTCRAFGAASKKEIQLWELDNPRHGFLRSAFPWPPTSREHCVEGYTDPGSARVAAPAVGVRGFAAAVPLLCLLESRADASGGVTKRPTCVADADAAEAACTSCWRFFSACRASQKQPDHDLCDRTGMRRRVHVPTVALPCCCRVRRAGLGPIRERAVGGRWCYPL